jgi:hypothetical protein
MGKKERIMAEAVGLPLPSEDAEAVEVGTVDMEPYEDAVKSVIQEYSLMIRDIIPTLAPQFRDEFKKSRDVMEYTEFAIENTRWLSSYGGRVTGSMIKKHTPSFKTYFRYVSQTETVLGKFFSSGLPVALPEGEREKHTYICAKTGSGKSELMKLLVHDYVRKRKRKAAVVVIDPHGDLAEEIARKKWFFGGNEAEGRLVYIDPKLFPDSSPSINPFDLGKGPSEDDIETAARSITDVFKELLKNADLTLQMETILVPCISVLLRKGGSSIRELQTFMDDERNGYLVHLGKDSPIENERIFFDRLFSDKNYHITKKSIATKIQSLLNSRTFSNFVARPSSFDLRAALDGGAVILLNLGQDSSDAIGRFVVAHIQSIISQRVNVPKERRVPCHMFIDECQRFVSPSIETSLTELRKFKLYMTLANQFIGQDMDTQFKHAVLSSTNIKFAGMNNAASLSALSKEMLVPVEEMQTLTVGEFFVKVGTRNAVRIKAPLKFAKGVDEMGKAEWASVLREQKAWFYRPFQDGKTAENERATAAGKPEGLAPKFDL